MTNRTINQVNPVKIKTGDVMALTYWVKVLDVKQNGEDLIVSDLLNDLSKIRVQGKELIEKSHSADQYETEEIITKTRAAELLVNSVNRPFTVSFQKADGTDRVLKGRLVAPEPLLGRSMVEDLETCDKNRLRQVDHRTINWLIVDGVKYTVK